MGRFALHLVSPARYRDVVYLSPEVPEKGDPNEMSADGHFNSPRKPACKPSSCSEMRSCSHICKRFSEASEVAHSPAGYDEGTDVFMRRGVLAIGIHGAVEVWVILGHGDAKLY